MDETAKKILMYGGLGLLAYFLLTSVNNGIGANPPGPPPLGSNGPDATTIF